MVFVFIVKYPIYILHLWLPKAHVEAPVSGSIILAGVMLKLGAYGVLKLLIIRGNFISYAKFLIRSLSLVGVILICFFRVRQLDIKIMVAYSSIVHMGPVLIGFLYGFEFGLLRGNFMLLAHGLCSSALFYILNLGYERQHSRRLLLMRGGLIFSPVLSY
jgi:NADH-ubiquinone oxidoreductase chain 4